MSTHTPDWGELLDDLDEPPLGTVAETLADSDATDLSVNEAYDHVEAAVDAGELVEDTETSAIGVVRLPESDAEPRGKTVETTEQNGVEREDAVAALRDVLRFYNNRLDDEIGDHTEAGEHPERPTTARDYFTEVRGWEDDTVDDLLLGWAPADHVDELVAYLFDRGHTREAMIATGALGEKDSGGLYATFSARYVLPYFDAEGEPAYAIARCTGGEGGGAKGYGGHPADWKAGKYAKLRHTDDRVPFEEPIYGLDTLDEGEHVVVAEGIADAITAREAGYAVLSPVAKEFKEAHYGPFAEALDDHGVERVTIVADADSIRNASADEAEPESIREALDLSLSEVAAGLGGALRTASKLGERSEADVRVSLPPAPGDTTSDLDEFVTEEWNGDLDALLRSAKPAEGDVEYEAATATVSKASEEDRNTEAAELAGDATSALWDLDLNDIESLEDGERTKNPFSHTGDSENYFVARRQSGGDVIAKDYKASGGGRTYNALTGLLVDAGKRRRDDPEGSLSDVEVFYAWKQAKDRNDLADDDPVPYRAIIGIAVEEGLVDEDDLVERDADTGEVADEDAEDTYRALPPGTYNDALDHIREEHGVNPGREPASRQDTDEDDDSEPVAPIALEKLDRLAGVDRERAARKRGLSIPTTSDAREELRNAIFREIRAGNTTVLDAPTALGKSYTVATEPWGRRDSTTGGAPVIQLHQTREARDEAASATADASATGAVLRGRKEACPVARGDHDPSEDPDVVVTINGAPASEWFDLMCDEKGLPFSTAHALAAERMDQDHDSLPCQAEGECEAIAQWEGLPRTDDGEPAVDVIHATHQFAFVPSLRANTNLVFDEQPDFRQEFTQDRIRRMVNAYLKEVDAPVTNFEAFVMLAGNTSKGTDAAAEQDVLGDLLDGEHNPAPSWFIDEPDAHALAPDVTRALWQAIRWGDPDRNGRYSASVYHEPPRLDADNDGYVAGTWLSVVLDEDHTVQSVRASPDLSQARSVIGLDAHPSMPLWQLNVDEGINNDAVLDPEERRLWRRYERGLTVVQVGDAARPRSGDSALEWMNDDRVQAVLEAIREQYGPGFKTALSTVQTERQLRELLDDVATEEIDADHTMHYGEEKSRNDFADEPAGYVYGCMDPGDGMILDAIAELGLDAAPVMVETEDGEVKREKGRTFEGGDADTAAAVLASVRENHVAQAAGRYARNADDAESRAVVYVDTNTAPAGFVDYETPGVEWLATDLQREIVAALQARPSATAREIADVVGCSKRHVLETLDRLEERDLVERGDGIGPYGADVYRDDGADTAAVDLGEGTNDGLYDSNRASLVTRDRSTREDDDDSARSSSAGSGTAENGGGPPLSGGIADGHDWG